MSSSPGLEPISDCSRRIDRVRQPPDFRLDTGSIYKSVGTCIDLPKLRDHFVNEGMLSIGAACKLIKQCLTIVKKEPNLLRLDAPFVVVGDIHGQFYDLLHIFELGGSLRENRYLFLGDYVDRGSFSVECLLYLCALKIVYPRNIYLIRGNHECRRITRYFTFRVECCLKLNRHFYDISCELFDAMPLAAVLNNQFFCVHGCISSQLQKVEDVCKIDRYGEIPSKGIMCDLLWSDPSPLTLKQTHNGKEEGFCKNEPRGCAQLVSHAAMCSFLDSNKLVSIIRAHQVAAEGVMFANPNPQSGFPALITVFSAPNYCDAYKNKGAILIYDGCNLDIRRFRERPHPFVLPNFLNIFTWAIPFLISQVNEMLVSLSKEMAVDEKKHRSHSNEYKVEELIKQVNSKRLFGDTSLRNTLRKCFRKQSKRTILQERAGTAENLNKTLLESINQSETILKLAGITPRDYQALSGSDALKGVVVSKGMSFKFAKRMDESNERWMNIELNK